MVVLVWARVIKQVLTHLAAVVQIGIKRVYQFQVHNLQKFAKILTLHGKKESNLLCTG